MREKRTSSSNTLGELAPRGDRYAILSATLRVPHATLRTPKTPVFGLPKSRPSPLQKTPFFALSEAKSVHF
jgi:hypothetical protein